MDLGIRGRKALLCGASRGLGKAAALAVAKRRRRRHHRGADARRARTNRRRNPRCDRRAGHDSRRRHHHRSGARGRAQGLSGAGHPAQQRRRSDARRLPHLDPRHLDRGARCDDARADRDDPRDRRRHDGARLWPHHQHLVAQREDPAARARPLERRAHRASSALSRDWRGRPCTATSPSTTFCPASSTATRRSATSRACSTISARASTRSGRSAPPASPAKRYGNPEEFGAYFAFLCSAHAGYISGPEPSDRRRQLSWHLLGVEFMER